VQITIKESVKLLIEDKIRKLGYYDDYTILDNEIRCGRTGSLIIFKGMQSYNSDNIKSLESFDIAWVEEAQTFTQHSLDLLRPTIRKSGSELWFSWNPRYKTDAVDIFFRKSPPNNAASILVNWNDNPWFVDTELYVDMLNDYQVDADKAEHVWGGAYGSSQGAILAKWVNEAEREGRINPDVSYDPMGSGLIVSSDIGFRDTCSWWYWQPLVGGFNLLKYDGDHGLDVDDWIPRVEKNIGEMGCKRIDKIWLPHDAKAKTFRSRHTSHEQFIRKFTDSKVGIVPISSKQDQIAAARAIIKKCEFNSTQCEGGLDSLRAWEFVYNEDSGVFSREPNHNWASHGSDAFAYGCQVVAEKINTIATLPIDQQLINKSIGAITMKSLTQQHFKKLKAKRDVS
jgi:phage terminase large subunit